jgi:hypothetical protein
MKAKAVMDGTRVYTQERKKIKKNIKEVVLQFLFNVSDSVHNKLHESSQLFEKQ